MTTRPRVLVIGLDGGSSNLLYPLMEQGVMPNLKHLAARGVRGELRSVYPPISAPAWCSFRTGVNPGKHGVYGFTRPSFGDGGWNDIRSASTVLNTAKDVRAARFWNLAGAEGRRIGILGQPFIYPVEPVNGVMVATSMTGGEHLACYPDTIVEEIVRETNTAFFERAVEDGVSLSAPYLRFLISSVQEQFKADRWLLEHRDFDIYMTVYTQTDPMQHMFYKYIDPCHPEYHARQGRELRPLINQFYGAIDEAIGQLVELCPDATVLLVSDHGAQAADKSFNVNAFLREQGFLTLEGGNKVAKKGSTVRSLASLAARLDIFNLQARLSYDARKRLIGWVSGRSHSAINYANSTAFIPSNNEMSIYIRRDLNPLSYKEVVAELIDGLKEYPDPETGEQILETVHHREEVLWGPYVSDAPDVLLAPNPPYQIRTGATANVIELRSPMSQSGNHRMDGFYVASGMHVLSLKESRDAQIMDMAPTLLYLLDVAVPEGMDGSVLADILDPAYVVANPVRVSDAGSVEDEAASYSEERVYTTEEEEGIKKSLQDMGYLH